MASRITQTGLKNEELQELVQNLIRGLSLVSFHFQKADDSSTFRKGSKTVRKHVTMLDGLALLITFNANEVSATGMIEEAKKITIIWAKNAETKATLSATLSTTAYMYKLIQMFRQQEEIPVIMAHVVQHCHHKVCTRLRKVAAGFKINVPDTSNFFGIEQDSANHQQLEASLRRKRYLRPTSTLIEALDTFVVRASNAMPTTPVNDLLPIMTFAFGLMTEEKILSELVKNQVVRRIRKVSDYYRTCGVMRTLMETRQGHELNHLQVF